MERRDYVSGFDRYYGDYMTEPRMEYSRRQPVVEYEPRITGYSSRYREPTVVHQQVIERPRRDRYSRGDYYMDDMAIEPYTERLDYGVPKYSSRSKYQSPRYATEYIDDMHMAPPGRSSRYYDRGYDGGEIVHVSRSGRDSYDKYGGRGDSYDNWGWSRSNKHESRDRYGDYYRSGGGYLRRSRSDPSIYGGY